ncbi:MAG: hypothetical protein EHM80_09825 [Nitrospiraceae bacterium]|nr:MAG: hypothetical protein EHM80_09825 [Nitrospiraceae bacterium]
MAMHERASHTTTLSKEVRMKQLLGVLVLAIGVMLVLNGPAWSDQKGKGKKDEAKETVEMAATAKVTIDEAIKTASEKVPGKVVEAELEMKHDKIIWEVEVVTAENKVMEVHIDAESGAVIEVEEEKPEKDMKREKKRERKQEHKP